MSGPRPIAVDEHAAVQPDTINRLLDKEREREREEQAAPPGPEGTRRAVEDHATAWATAYEKEAQAVAARLQVLTDQAAFWRRIERALEGEP